MDGRYQNRKNKASHSGEDYVVQRNKSTYTCKQKFSLNDKGCDKFFKFPKAERSIVWIIWDASTIQPLTEIPSSLGTSTFWMDLCHIHKH